MSALWILLHHHRHGIDAFLVEAEDSALPHPVDVIEANLSSFEPEDEYTEWRGPCVPRRYNEQRTPR